MQLVASEDPKEVGKETNGLSLNCFLTVIILLVRCREIF
jgi:hypothetical protein